jgi:hypothetical protein
VKINFNTVHYRKRCPVYTIGRYLSSRLAFCAFRAHRNCRARDNLVQPRAPSKFEWLARWRQADDFSPMGPRIGQSAWARAFASVRSSRRFVRVGRVPLGGFGLLSRPINPSLCRGLVVIRVTACQQNLAIFQCSLAHEVPRVVQLVRRDKKPSRLWTVDFNSPAPPGNDQLSGFQFTASSGSLKLSLMGEVAVNLAVRDRRFRRYSWFLSNPAHPSHLQSRLFHRAEDPRCACNAPSAWFLSG